MGPPDTPTEFTLVPGDQYILLSWKVPFTNGSSSITNYIIYRGTSSDDMPVLVELGNVLSYNDSAVTNDITYFYAISAKNILGEGPKTMDINATPEAPTEQPNELPTCEISVPIDGVTWSKTATITGSASDSDGEIEKVEIRFNDGKWLLANGTDTWSYEVNPEDLPNGENIIYARSFDGENYSNEVTVTVNVDVPEDVLPKDLFEEPVFWVGIIILIILILLLLMFIIKRMPEREYKEEEEEEEEEPEEEEEEPEEEEEEEEEEPEEDEEED
jgi:hypothetical protein